LNPASVNVTVYEPGRRSMMRYAPFESVLTERTRSMRTGLDTSTVTPGRTAPEVSFTTPAIDAWAKTNTGAASIPTNSPSTR
jgi:hypothetical protein